MAADAQNDDETRTFTVLAAGTVVSHYKIVSKIGAGGMGEVYLAKDTELQRQVALKFLPPHLCVDEDCRKRFKREAQSAARLDHSNIVTVHEVSEFRGRPFIVMQYIEGQSLKDYRHDDKFTISRILALSIQVCDGLKAAHKVGIVHRDIKPSNILIDSEGRPRIVDFGLASSRNSEKITMTGSTLGTVGYMSPEQARGQITDHRSDLFSLGIVLYEMTTGQRPFRGEDEAATLLAVTQDTPEPMSQQREDVPAELEHIVTKLLEKDPASRYQSADDLLADLTELRQSIASGVSRAPKTRRLIGRKLLYVSLGLVSALVVFVVVSAYALHSEWLSFLPGTMTPEERVLASLQTGAETCRIVIAPFWGQTDEAIDEGKVMQDLVRRQISEVLAGDEQVEILEADFSDIPRSHNRARALGEKHEATMVIWGEILVLHGEVEIQPYLTIIGPGPAYERSASVLEANLMEPNQLELRRSKAEEIGDMAILVAARYYYRRGDLEKAISFVDKTKLATWESLNLKGAIAWAQGRSDEEEKFYRQALALDSSSVGALLKMAGIFKEKEQWDSALAAYHTALSFDPDNELISIGISRLYGICDQHEQAISYLEDAVEANPESSALRTALGWSLLGGERVAEAMASYRRAIELDSTNGDAYYGLGWVYEFSFPDSLELAVHYYSEAIRVGTQRTGGLAPYLTLGRVYTKLEKHEEAISALLKAVSLSPWYLGTYSYLQPNYIKLGQNERGITLLEGLVSKNPDNVELRRQLILFYVYSDLNDKAIEEAETIVRITPEDGDAHADLGTFYDSADSLIQAERCYQEALRRGTKRWRAYAIRHVLAWNYMAQAKYDEAARQGGEALKAVPPSGYAKRAHWLSGCAYICQDRFDEAVDEFRKATVADSADVYGHFYCFLALARSGAVEQARNYIDGVSGAFKDKSWSGWIVHFLNGDVDEKSFLNEAAREDTTTSSEGKLCEAYYYVGMTHLLGCMNWLEPEKPDTTSARNYFRKCVDTNQKRFYEYLFARAELARLNGST